MIRAVMAALILGALAAGGLYAARLPAWRSMITGAPGTSEPVPAAKLATEDWPICTTMAAMGSEADWAELDPDFAAGKKALVAEDWKGAIAALKLAALRDPRNADNPDARRARRRSFPARPLSACPAPSLGLKDQRQPRPSRAPLTPPPAAPRSSPKSPTAKPQNPQTSSKRSSIRTSLTQINR